MQPGPRSTESLDVTIFTSDTLVPSDLLAGLAGEGFSVTPGQMVRRTVLETFDGRLSAAGLRLELREQVGYELVLSGKASAPSRVATTGVPCHARDLPAGPFRARLAGILGVRALVPTLTFTAWEATATKRDRAGKARVVVRLHDQVTVQGHEPIPIGPRVEVEEMTGYALDAAKASVLLRTLGAPPSDDDLVGVAAAAAGVAVDGLPHLAHRPPRAW